MEKKKVTFAEAFIDNFDAVKEITEKRRKGLEEVASLFVQRVECEIQYSKSLKEISNAKHDFIQGTLALGLQAFQVDCMNRSDQAATFAENARSEIIEPMRLLVKEHESLIKSLSSQVKKLTSEISTISEKLQETKEQYTTALKEAEDALYECENFRLHLAEKIKEDAQMTEKMNIKIQNLLMIYKEAKDTYKKYSTYALGYKTQYSASMKSIVDVLQKQEEQRIDFVRDSLQKFFVYEAAVEQNHKYDIQHVSSAIQEIVTEKDIEAIIHHETQYVARKEVVPLIAPLDIKKSGWDPLFSNYETNYVGKEERLDYVNIVEEAKKQITRQENKEYKGHLSLFQSVFKKIFIESTAIDTETSNQLN